MVDAGELSAAELGRMTVPTWNRTPDEFAAPFREGAVDLELGELEASQRPDRFLAALERDGEREAFAAAVTGFVRAFTVPSLLAGWIRGATPPSGSGSATSSTGVSERGRRRGPRTSAPTGASWP